MGRLGVHAVRSYPSGTVVCSGSDFRSTVNLLRCICSLLFLMSGLFHLYSIVFNYKLMGEVHWVSDTVVSSH